MSGGVAVGAVADLMLQPGGAFLMGTITGVVSAFGYRILQVSFHVKRFFDQILFFIIYLIDYSYSKQGKLFDKMKLHDTCGINNLHGMPGVISALASAVMCGIATESMYGAR